MKGNGKLPNGILPSSPNPQNPLRKNQNVQNDKISEPLIDFQLNFKRLNPAPKRVKLFHNPEGGYILNCLQLILLN